MTLRGFLLTINIKRVLQTDPIFLSPHRFQRRNIGQSSVNGHEGEVVSIFPFVEARLAGTLFTSANGDWPEITKGDNTWANAMI